MNLTKRTSVLVGMGIGGMLALAGFGVSRIFHRSPLELTRAQALLPPPQEQHVLVATAAPTIPPSPTPSDNLADRYSVDPQKLGTLIGRVFTPPSAPPAAP